MAKGKSGGKVPSKKTTPTVIQPGWERFLRTVRGGSFKQSFGNAQLILTHHTLWKGLWAYDEFIGDVVTTRKPNWDLNAPSEEGEPGEWTEQDTMRMRGWLDRNYGIDLGTQVVGQVLRVVAEGKRVHAVRAYLDALKWDKKERLDTWLIRIGGAEDSSYTRAIGSKMLIGAVARAKFPGCKNDCMPVFEGLQGSLKSTMVEVLFSRPWYSGTPFKMGTKDGYQTLRRKWGLEIPELSSFDRAEMNDIKAFLSEPVDNYRPSYGIKNADFKRQSICVGTTNDREWHKDPTGGRRFFPVYLNGVLPGKPKRIDIKRLRAERDQLWAEAAVRYAAGEKWHLDTPQLIAAAEAQIEHRRQIDPWEPLVAAWIEKRKTRLENYGVSTAEVLDAMQVEARDRTKAHEMRAGAVLRLLGWERKDVKAASGERYKYWPLPDGPFRARGGEQGDAARENKGSAHLPTSNGTPTNVRGRGNNVFTFDPNRTPVNPRTR